MKNVSKILALAASGLALMVGLALTFRVGAPPDFEIRPERPAIGTRAPVVVTAFPRGAASAASGSSSCRRTGRT